MKKVMVGVAVALAVTTSNAAADGIDRRPPPTIAAPQPYVVPPSWTGFYIGAGVGEGAFIQDVTVENDGDRLHFNGIGGDGVLGTAIVGWDLQVSPNALIGVFGDYDFSNINSDFSVADPATRLSIDHDHSWSIGGRIGLLSSPSTLWYATGGFTQARFDASATINSDVSVSRGRTFDGFFVGGGVDTRLAASNWFLRLEYRFSDFGSERVFRDDLTATSINVDPTMHSARLTLAYKFGSGGFAWGNGWGSGWGWGR
ncbi:MAG: porin family protein [Hyphomicrobiaceae bacterium]|nr:porin family protein [Hyphomicrobiaceae bacterium]